MATIILEDDEENGNQEEVAVPQETPQPEAEAAPEATPEPDDIPEKWRGKSLKDIVRANEELEKVLGRQGAELGELRKTADDFIRSNLVKATADHAKAAPQETEDDDSGFFIQPKAAIDRAIENHPLVRELRQHQTRAQQERAVRTLAEKHPDYMDVMSNPEFREFVAASPVHVRLMQQADRDYDVVAADYVMSAWKARKQPAPQAPAAPEVDPMARRAAVNAGKVPASNAAPGGGSKPVFNRADLIRKQVQDPEWYAAHVDEIELAYAEKRVR